MPSWKCKADWQALLNKWKVALLRLSSDNFLKPPYTCSKPYWYAISRFYVSDITSVTPLHVAPIVEKLLTPAQVGNISSRDEVKRFPAGGLKQAGSFFNIINMNGKMLDAVTAQGTEACLALTERRQRLQASGRKMPGGTLPATW